MCIYTPTPRIRPSISLQLSLISLTATQSKGRPETLGRHSDQTKIHWGSATVQSKEETDVEQDPPLKEMVILFNPIYLL